MINNTINISWSNYLRDVISNLKEEGYDFSHMAETDIITLAHKRDMTYDFYLKHNMSAFEWKLNSKINKDKNLINKFPKIGDILLILNLTVIVFDFNNFFYINDGYIYH